jgi:hypothetical protein
MKKDKRVEKWIEDKIKRWLKINNNRIFKEVKIIKFSNKIIKVSKERWKEREIGGKISSSFSRLI